MTLQAAQDREDRVARLANALAWVALAGLIALALLAAHRLGFAGVLILGLLTAFIAFQAELQQHVPAPGLALFAARMQQPRSVEERAATASERQGFIAPLRFFRWCGLTLAAIGLVGFAVQIWRARP